MRILSRFLAKLSRSNEALPGALRGGLAASIVLASSVAAAQPTPAKPPATAPATAKPTAPAAKPAAKPTAKPTKADQTGDAAAGAQAGAGAAAPAQPAPAQPAPKADEPLMPPDPATSGATGAGAAGTITVAPAAPAPTTPLPAPATPEPKPAAVAAEPDKDLVKIGGERPANNGDVGARPSDVYAEDWWTQARPVFEIHGYYRVRSELFHNFALGRKDQVTSLWPQPADNDYTAPDGTQVSAGGRQTANTGICGANPLTGKGTPCQDNTQAGANMRFRINPELHISDNLRVMAQLDLLDNVVLGSTPEGYFNVPSANGGFQVGSRGGYTPTGAFASTQWAPVAGVNSTTNSITVKRAWGEYVTPIGLLRFGRMPSHWGLGMLANAGDGHDSDWQSTSDRIMLVTGVKKWDLYFAAAWDFANEGPTSARLGQQQGQPYDLNQLDDVNQFVLVAARRRNPELQRLELAKGEAVVNGGVYFVFRNQVLASDQSGRNNESKSPTIGGDASTSQISDAVRAGLTRRNARAYIPDLWLQFLYRKFRFEAEAALIYGSMDSLQPLNGGGGYDEKLGDWKIRQFGLATQSEFRAMEDKLRIQFGFGYATGDSDLDSLAPQDNALQAQRTNNRSYSEFRFHPDYRVDLILFRNILTRVEGAYYFRPSVEYDFTRDRNGQRLGGGGALIWSRASEFVQTPGHARDLGVELDFQLYYQSKDGALNDDPDKMGGFFTSLQYGVMFPLAGFNYLPGELARASAQQQGLTTDKLGLDTATAQVLRWYLGILF
jgi:uncharacterized protein (TIGR04551 family)